MRRRRQSLQALAENQRSDAAGDSPQAPPDDD
jgi:hypothetical protein